MKIAILSDIHDHIWNLEKVINEIEGKVEALIFCGDMVAPFTSAILAKANLPTYLCLGNNDEDHIRMLQKGSDKFIWTGLSEEYGTVEIDGKKIAFCHYPKLGELLAKSGEFDAVFHGHTHETKNEIQGKTLLLNPGSVCGIHNGKPGIPSYAIYNTSTNSAEIIEIKWIL